MNLSISMSCRCCVPPWWQEGLPARPPGLRCEPASGARTAGGATDIPPVPAGAALTLQPPPPPPGTEPQPHPSAGRSTSRSATPSWRTSVRLSMTR